MVNQPSRFMDFDGVITFPSPLPLFKPNRRQAILVNSYDVAESCSAGVIEIGLSRGSRRVYEMEGILTQDIKGDKNFRLTAKNKEFMRQKHVGESAKNIDQTRKAIRYNALARIQPYNDQREKFDKTLAKFIKSSREDTLTFLYGTCHGEVEGVALDETIYPYEELIGQLDEVKGNKVIILMACFSGAIIDVIDSKSKAPEKYTVMTSAGADQKGINWAEDEIHSVVSGHIRGARPLSKLAFMAPDHELGGEKPIPQIRANFDVII